MPILMKMGSVGLPHSRTSKHDSKEDRLHLYQEMIRDMLRGTLVEVEMWYKDLYQKQFKADVSINRNSFAICERIEQAMEPRLKNIIEACPDDELNHLRFYLSVELEDNGRYIVTFHDRSFDNPDRMPYNDQTIELVLSRDKLPYSVFIVKDINNATWEFVIWEGEMCTYDKSISFEKPNIVVHMDNTKGMEETIVYASVQRYKKLQVNLSAEGDVTVGEVKITSDND